MTHLTERQKRMREFLMTLASQRKVITYGELGRLFGIDEGYKYSEVSHEVGAISYREVEKGRPMLSVIVVRKEDGIPGNGFFTYAKDLGRMKKTTKSERNRIEFFAKELGATHDYWVKHIRYVVVR